MDNAIIKFLDVPKVVVNEESEKVHAQCIEDKIVIRFEDTKQIISTSREDKVIYNTCERLVVNGYSTDDHAKLKNLDFENSGHTGFASEKQLNTKVPKRLNTLPQLPIKASISKARLYVDNNGEDSQITISDLYSRFMRQGKEIPSDMQAGEYLLLEKGDK